MEVERFDLSQLICSSAQRAYPETPLDPFAYPMMRVLIAARALGSRAIDGPCGNYGVGLVVIKTLELARSLAIRG
jgi:malyl-CoA/(S)-citramalyl-CoA lyase